jgi:ammonium transporter, Amt family
MIEYIGVGKTGSVAGASFFFGNHPHQLLVQFLAALTIIVWDAFVTATILYFIKYVLRMKLRLSDEELEIGDIAVHGEEAYPVEEGLSALSMSAAAEASPSTEEPVRADLGSPNGRLTAG